MFLPPGSCGSRCGSYWGRGDKVRPGPPGSENHMPNREPMGGSFRGMTVPSLLPRWTPPWPSVQPGSPWPCFSSFCVHNPTPRALPGTLANKTGGEEDPGTHRGVEADPLLHIKHGDPGGNFWKPPQVFPVVLPLYLLCEGLDGKIWSACGESQGTGPLISSACPCHGLSRDLYAPLWSKRVQAEFLPLACSQGVRRAVHSLQALVENPFLASSSFWWL